MSRKFSFWILLAVIAAVGFLFYRVMAGFLLPMFLAALLAILFQPLHRWILKKCKNRPQLSAALTTGAVMLIVLAPAIWVLSLAAVEGFNLVSRFDAASTRERLARVRTRLGLEMPGGPDLRRIESGLVNMMEHAVNGTTPPEEAEAAAMLLVRLDRVEKAAVAAGHPAGMEDQLRTAIENVRTTAPDNLEHEAAIQSALGEIREFKHTLLGGPYQAWAAELANPSDEKLRELNRAAFATAQKSAISFTGATFGALARFLLGQVIMVVTLYFFFADGPSMLETLMRLSPMDDRHERELIDEFVKVSRAVVMATLLAALAQGLLAGVGYFVAGVESVFLLTLLTATLAMVPFVGATTVWLPVCIWLYLYEERTWAAIGLAAWCSIVVANIDNFIKPWVLHGQSKLHPLLALLSVLGGVQLLGPIGILVGPMVVVFLQTLLNILHHEIVEHETAQTQPGAPQVAAAGAGASATVTPDDETSDEPKDTAGGDNHDDASAASQPAAGKTTPGTTASAKKPPASQSKRRKKKRR